MTGTNCDLFTHKSVPVIFEPPCTNTEGIEGSSLAVLKPVTLKVTGLLTVKPASLVDSKKL